MAIDSREKRASTVAVSLYPAAPPVQAGTAGLDKEDRQLSGYGYVGIPIVVPSGLDTREGRASSIAISFYPATPSIQAGSAGLDDEDRQIAGYGYAKIDVGDPPAPTATPSRARTVMLLRLRR